MVTEDPKRAGTCSILHSASFRTRRDSAEPITRPPSEIFLAMDRGTVDGFTWPVADAFTEPIMQGRNGGIFAT